MKSQVIRVPNLIEISKPFKVKISPHYEKLTKSGDLWIKNHCGKLSEKFLRDDRARYYAQGAPHGTFEHLEAVMHYGNYLWIYDEISDKSPEIAVKYFKLFNEIQKNLDYKVDCEVGVALKE